MAFASAPQSNANSILLSLLSRNASVFETVFGIIICPNIMLTINIFYITILIKILQNSMFKFYANFPIIGLFFAP
jgi:hypothetical protein